MFLLLLTLDGALSATLQDCDDFGDLHVELVDLSADDAAAALHVAGLGRLDGDYAWLDVGALRSHGPGTDGWLAGFDSMLSYARTHGWTSDDGGHVRAHLVRSASGSVATPRDDPGGA